MNRTLKVRCVWAVLTALGLLGLAVGATAQETAPGTPAAGTSLDAEKYPVLAQSTVPVLCGDLWKTASQDSKVAYVWGLCSWIEVERIAMNMVPEIKVRNISAVAAEALANVPMNEIVRAIDDFYQADPGHLKVPVLRIIWDTMVKPKVKTGVAGRPLEAQVKAQ